MRKMVTFADAQTAREDCAPNLHEIVACLASSSSEKEPTTVDEKEQALAKIREEVLRKDPSKGVLRRDVLKRIDSSRNQLPDRLELGGLIIELLRDGGPYAREQLINIARSTPLTWGAWQGLKAVFKQAEHERDLELFGVLAARFDTERAARRPECEVSIGTLTYLVRRAWRELRRMAMSLSAGYPDAAVEVLRFYPGNCRFDHTFLAKNIFDRDARARNATSTGAWSVPQFHNPPFADLWRISPRPLLTLLERAESEHVRRAASQFLMQDFRGALSDLHPIHISRLVETRSPTAHRFCVWLLQGRLFDHSAFRELGLHDVVLALIDSPDPEARRFASDYLRTYARDVHIQTIVKIARDEDINLSDAAVDLLAERGKEELSIETWAELASKEATFELAKGALESAFDRDKFDETVVEKLFVSEDKRTADLGKSLLERADSKDISVSFLARTAQTPAVDPQVRSDCLTKLAISEREALSGKEWIDIIEELPKDFEEQLVGVVAQHTTPGLFAENDKPLSTQNERGIEKLWSEGLRKGRRARIARKILLAKFSSNGNNGGLSPQEHSAARNVFAFERVFAACEHWDPQISRFALRLLPLCLETRWDVDIAVTLAESHAPDVVAFAEKALRGKTFEYLERDRLIRTLGLSQSRSARLVGLNLASQKEWFLSSATFMALMRSADSAIRRLAVEKAWKQTGTNDVSDHEIFLSLLRETFKQVHNDIEDGCHYLKCQRAEMALLDTLAELGIKNAPLATVTLAFLRGKKPSGGRTAALAHMAAISRLQNAAQHGEKRP